MNPIKILFCIYCLFGLLAIDCLGRCQAQDAAPVAGNEAVAEFMRDFAPRGVMADGSQPTPAKMAINQFQLDPRLQIELVAEEPAVEQPLFVSWDSKGRLWVVQYRQYQFPAGLKVIRYDQHLRAVFDKIPEPPPLGPQGADRISVFSDTNGDGNYDQHQIVLEGLNIATAVQYGRGGIWVLNPPYLLFYPDDDGDGFPDSSPEVCLSGFGLQDTHSVANSLLFGPDGWLYGANGSTTTGSVSSAVSRGVSFEGQCIWRYHPESKVFEIYAEGGGNTFSLEIDSVGRVFSGTNHGGTRGFYYPQGSYSSKNWGKHGPLTNPFAFGYFHPMQSQGDDRRFPQAFCIYEGGLLPDDFHQTIVAPNSLHNLVWNSELLPEGATFRTVDRANLLATSDRWFRPVHAGVGPDGAVYLCDWYDARLSHVSPLDDWHKTSGRIYRIVPRDSTLQPRQHDLTMLSSEQLVELMITSANKWLRQRAMLELSWRGDRSVLPTLIDCVDRRGSLDALWAIHGLNALTMPHSENWLFHENPHVRRWVVRLLGDRHEAVEKMVELARHETDVEVRSQLAASARRIDPALGIRILAELLMREDDVDDPHLPLMIWWGLVEHTGDWSAMRSVLGGPEIWRSSIMRRHIASRLMQRYASSGSDVDLQRCAELITLTEDGESKNGLMIGLLQAFEGRPLPPLPAELKSSLDNYQASLGQSGLLVGIRQGDSASIAESVRCLADRNQGLPLRMQLANVLGSERIEEAKATILRLACGDSEPSLQRVALVALRNYDDPSIGPALVARLDSSISAEHGLQDAALRTLAARPTWAEALLNEIISWRLSPRKVPLDVVQQLRSHGEDRLQDMIIQAFGKPIEISSEEKVANMHRLRQIVADPAGEADSGRQLFMERCANCHQLFGEGRSLGPPLDGYERGNMDFWLINLLEPSAEIREAYQSYSVLTVDGRLITGMIDQRDGSAVTLRSADDHQTKMAWEEIEQLRPLETSLMPDDLLSGLSDQQIKDLFAYLSQGARK